MATKPKNTSSTKFRPTWLVAAGVLLAALFAVLLTPGPVLAQDVEPTPLPKVGGGTYETDIYVTIEAQADGEFFAWDDLFVKQGPGIGAIKGLLPYGNSVNVGEWSGDWAHIFGDEGEDFGWVLADFLQPKPPKKLATSSGACIIPAGSTAYITASALTKRSGPGSDYASKGSLSYGAAVTVTGCDASGYWAETTEGIFLGSAYLATSKPSTTRPIAPATTTGSGSCDPIAITSLAEREPAMVNGTKVSLQVRDLNACARDLFYNETGVDDPNTSETEGGQNYVLSLPEGWVAFGAARSAELQCDGCSAKQYLDCPIVYVHGPFVGGMGLYEGSIRVVPDEWLDARLDFVRPIQSAQCGFEVEPVEHR